MQVVKNNTKERELIFSRLLDAPIKLVWEVWTSPAHIALWWGPDGFTNTIRIMEVKPGGKWELTMHGPDGRDYEIHIVFREIVKEQRIVYEQLNQFKCIATIEFEGLGNKTMIHWQMLFESKDTLLQAAKDYGVDIGLKQNGEKLVNYLQKFETI
jgi:uncharacterized protein YndB with AHSA1/START domain